jgi:hypothetical protein
MPRLYCEQHGREHEASTILQQEHYRQEGEAVLIVKGWLSSGPWLCDKCNATLPRGGMAYLLVFFSKAFTFELESYDFSYERRYFGRRFDATAYGASVRGIRWGQLEVRPHTFPPRTD